MKKSFIAIAVATFAGGAMAQVSLTGKLGFSYQKDATVPAAVHGLHMTDGDLNFAATEDLGGGTKITAKSAFVSRGRGNAIAGRDASLTLGVRGMEYVLGAMEKCNRIDNVAGAPVSLSTGHDAIFDAGTVAGTIPGALTGAARTLDGSCHNVDTVGMTAPIGPVTFGLSYNELDSGVGNGGKASYTTLSLDGNLGALSLGLELRNARSTEGGALQTYHDALTTTRVTASYDFGGPVVGMGFQTANHYSPNQTTFSAAMPFGAIKVGLMHSMRGKASNINFGVQEEVSGTAVGVDYSLSKQTTLNASYGTYSNSAVNSSEYRIRLLKAF